MPVALRRWSRRWRVRRRNRRVRRRNRRVRRRGHGRWRAGRRLRAALGNADGVNAPALPSGLVVGAQSPAQLDVLPGGGRRQIHYDGREAGVAADVRAGPHLAKRERIEAALVREVVAARDEAAARGDDVLKGSAVNADLQDATVSAMEIDAMPEG